MVTARDVAIHAGVSVAMVSRVLMGAPHVTPEKRQKVLAAVQALDYRPDQVARSLRTRRSNLIGLVVSTIENQFFTEVARAAEQAAIRHGYNLVISNTDEKLEREQDDFSILSQQLVAGVILAPAPGDVASRRYLCEPAFPVVLINRILRTPWASAPWISWWICVDLLGRPRPRPQEAETIVLPCRLVSRAVWREAHQTLKAGGTLQAV